MKKERRELIRASAVPMLPELVKELKPPSRAQLKLADVAAIIHESPPDDAERAYMARQLVQCTLPHSDPGDVGQWTRTNGNLTLGIVPGRDLKADKAIGYPFGSIPRLLLFWITSEAVRTKKHRLELGSNLARFMTDIGLDPGTGGGKRGDAKRLRDQMHRLFRATISFQLNTADDPRRHGEGWRDMKVTDEGELWWDPKRPDQLNLWESWIELGDKFFKAITDSPVPCDLRALCALKKSPLALDLYAWATYKTFVVSIKRKSQFVPWIALQRQFGTDYSRTRDFKAKAIAALKKIESVYLDFKWQNVPGGVVILPSATAVPPAPWTLEI